MEEQRQCFALPQKRRMILNRIRKPTDAGLFHFFLWVLFLCSTLVLLPSFKETFRPVLILPRLRSDLSASALDQGENKWVSSLSASSIEDRVIFPDHVLFLMKKMEFLPEKDELECVYHGLNSTLRLFFPVISVHVEPDLQIARCPLPPRNFSSMVTLKQSGHQQENQIKQNKKEGLLKNWDNLVYDAFLDGKTVVVFAKGLNLKPDRASDPSQFTCYFDWVLERRRFLRSTKALTAAQEVIRCLFPRSLQGSPSNSSGIRVTVSGPGREPLPSVAKLQNTNINKAIMNQPKFKMCICTMLWNQASFLREWIMYHGWLGVQRWFIYDNNSDDQIEDVIQTLDSYNITRHLWPWIKTQEAGFSHCALRARTECEWVGFMDVDEFFYFPLKNPLNNSNQQRLQALLKRFSHASSSIVGEIRTACYSFGPSGLTQPPHQGVMVGYSCRLKRPERHKSIVRLDALNHTLVNVIHHFHLKKGFRYVNLSKKVAVINHYKYQVWEVFKAKFCRRVATYVADWHDNHNEGSKDRAPGLGREAIEPPNWAFQFCEVWDNRLRDFVLGNLVDSQETMLLPWENNPISPPHLFQ